MFEIIYSKFTVIQQVKIIFLISLLFLNGLLFSQDNSSCEIVIPICYSSGLDFSSNANSNLDADQINPGNFYDCLSSSPNPSWFYFQIASSGDLDLEIEGQSGDIDFILYGPFEDVQTAVGNCDSYTAADVYDCSYSTSATETFQINNAQVGEVYVLLITNYLNITQPITLEQTNFNDSDGGETEWDFPCEILSITSSFTDCDIIGTYNVSGQVIVFNNISKNSDKYKYDLDMSYASSGVYLVKMGNSSIGYKIGKIIVK